MYRRHRPLVVIALMLLAAATSAQAVQPALIYDLPQKDIEAIRGFDAWRLRGRAAMEQRRSDAFDVDTFKVRIVPLEWVNRPAAYAASTIDSQVCSRETWPWGSVAD